MQTTEHPHSGAIILIAIEMSNKEWMLKMTNLRQERLVKITAGNVALLVSEMAKARQKFGVPKDAPVYACYEAGRDGFWLARYMKGQGIDVRVVDPASIEVSQRQRRLKTDRIDAGKLLDMLKRRVVYGEKPWRECRVPTEEQEDQMRIVREHGRLKGERTAQVNRIRSLLVLHGVRIQGRKLHGVKVRRLQTPDHRPLGEQLIQEIERGQKRLALIEEQIEELSRQREGALQAPGVEADRKAAQLSRIKAIGAVTATALSRDFFWRDFRNRREVGSMAGLTGSPYQSGTMDIDQGISKAGNARIRALMIELAWTWQRLQPQSELSRWYRERVAQGGKRHKRTLIVALARKLLVAFWKYLETGEVPKGATLKAA